MSRRDEHDPVAHACGRLDEADRLVVDDRLVDRHRELVLGLELHGRLEVLGVLQRRQVHDADDDARVGDTDPDLAVEPGVLRPHGAERRGQCLAVRNLTVPHHVRVEVGDGGTLDGEAVGGGHLYGGDGARLDVEPDDGLGSACHGGVA
jgi:hypothetical protein